MSTLSVPVSQWEPSQQFLKQPSDNPVATLPVPNSTQSFWLNTPGANPLANEGSHGPLTTDADICIIGSGITGVSTAYHLAKQLDQVDRPIKTVILEAREFCSGATGRNGGHLIPNFFFGFQKHILDYGVEEAKKIYGIEQYTEMELLKIVEENSLGETIDLSSGAHLMLFITDKEETDAMADYVAAKAAALEVSEVEWLSKETMQGEYGTSFSGCRHPGHNLWPLKLVTQLFTLASQHNPDKFSLALHTSTAVTAVTPSSSSARRWSLSTPRGTVKCSYVIHATNAYASHLLPHMRGPTGIIPTRGHVMALRASAPLSQHTNSSWWANEGFEYWFPRPVNTPDEKPLIILGGGREAALPTFDHYEGDDSVFREDVGKVLRDFLPGLFPEKFDKGRASEMEWTGIMGFTKIGDPFVGPVLDPSKPSHTFAGQYIAAGYSGHGMPRAFACGEAVAGMVTAEITREKWTEPAWLPRHFLTYRRPVV
ncbi:FAD dependent oxidoreductase [Tricholoma matsutake]|nr:FAD dependent oxidoreductase [Tricholoma matsutake 945]